MDRGLQKLLYMQKESIEYMAVYYLSKLLPHSHDPHCYPAMVFGGVTQKKLGRVLTLYSFSMLNIIGRRKVSGALQNAENKGKQIATLLVN